MAYKKGHHCNNNCVNADFSSETTYVGYQFGEPVEFDTDVIYCEKDNSVKYYPSHPRYNCPIYQAANTASTGQGVGVVKSSNDQEVTPCG